jgi:ubiquinone/menaquinone biosynthesis C-methylase UbiE
MRERFPSPTLALTSSCRVSRSTTSRLSGRTQALQEIARVVKSGGRIVIIDISRTDEYVRVLHEAGFLGVQQSGPSLMFLIPTRILAATRK